MYFCATSTSFFVFSIFFIFFCLLDINVISFIFLLWYISITISIIVYSLLIQSDFIRSYLSQASDISEAQLISGISYANGLKLGSAILIGLLLSHLDRYINDLINMNQVNAYYEFRLKHNYPPMNAQIFDLEKKLLFRVSTMTELAKTVGKFFENLPILKDIANFIK